jgi:membrane fusion protein (multidrug efflux system)
MTPNKKPSMTRRMLVMLVLVGILLGGIVGFNLFKAAMMKKYMAHAPQPPATVTTMPAAFQDWQLQLAGVGTLRAWRGVDLSTEVAGLVKRVHFRSGQDVKPGALLVELDTDAERAELKALEAAAGLARTTLERDRAQLAAQALSQAVVDGDEADLKSKLALVEQQKALIARKAIRAPFGGRVGISAVNPGQYLKAGDKIVTLQAIDRLLVDFAQPQRELAKVALGERIVVSSDARPERSYAGKVSAINPAVDPGTRNVQIEASVDNAKRELLPGMFVRVQLLLGGTQRYITLPQTAISYNPYGATVFLAKPSEQKDARGRPVPVAQQVFVTIGPTRGDQVAIVKGIDAGATVVTSGQLKLKNGTPLIVDNRVIPANAPHPTPQER